MSGQHLRAGDRLILKITTSDVDKLPVAGGAPYPDTAPIADDAIPDP